MAASESLAWRREFLPKIFTSLKGYRRELVVADVFAGVTVGIVALPLAMAFAIASGVGPERGLFTAIVAGFLISVLGGSRLQIGGPTGAFVVIVYDVVARYGYSGLVTATFMAGFMLLIMGLARFGSMIKFIPYPVTTGFTTGIAVIIFSSQVKDFLGLQIASVPSDFIEKWVVYVSEIRTANLYTVTVGAASLVVLLLLRRYYPKWPGALIMIVGGAFAVWLFDLPVETVGTRFGEMPHMLPHPSISEIEWSRVRELFPSALTIALLAAIESLLSAVVADGMSGDRHSSNCELVAQGFANICSVLFGGIPATGAIARTATNIKSGAKTPVAGMIHALTLLLVLLIFAPLASAIPLTCLGAVLFVVAWNMSELDHFRYILRAPRSDVAVLLATFFLTILVDLTVAVEVGIVLAALLFMKRMSEIGTAIVDTPIVDFETKRELAGESADDVLAVNDVPVGVEVFEINGPFFFGVADKLQDTLNEIETPPKVFILRMRRVPVIDATGLHALREFHLKCRRHHVSLILSGVQGQVAASLRSYGLYSEIGGENVKGTIKDALERAQTLVS